MTTARRAAVDLDKVLAEPSQAGRASQDAEVGSDERSFADLVFVYEPATRRTPLVVKVRLPRGSSPPLGNVTIPIESLRSRSSTLAHYVIRTLGLEEHKEAEDYLALLFRLVSLGVRMDEISLPEREPEVRVITPETAHGGAPGSAIDPLAGARERGRRFAAEAYASPDNLPLLQAKVYAGRNERSINEQRKAGELYALLPPGITRGFRYPKWQFDADPVRLAAILRPFVDANANCWVIHSFMLRRRAELGNRSPSAVILDPRAELAPLASLAARDLAGEQGAS
ncbi:hypothetical protein [Paraburkholderia sp. UCT70]|uniref:hypothetical protein n=1 Tax=Paraburkholderia sp. UCT70 TaxID=2991068 RepID=UPI003D224172